MHRKTDNDESNVEPARGPSAESSSRARRTNAAPKHDAETAAATDLDFEALDLSIETIEERISPSETNVFDK